MALAGAVGLFGIVTANAQATDFFDWGQGQNPLTSAYTPVITVTDANAAAAVVALQASKTAGQALAVKINAGVTLSPATINTVFNNGALGPIKYVFADYEGPNASTQTTNLVNAITPTSTGSGLFAGGTHFAALVMNAPRRARPSLRATETGADAKPASCSAR